jgi:DNA polymerase/3'-5' exonuclease PolX
MKLKHAKALADRIVEILTPYCSIINIAGSIRREKPEVKDVEIVAIVKRYFHQDGLFGDGKWLIDPGFEVTIKKIAQTIIKGKPDGRYMQIRLKEYNNSSMMLDLFLPDPPDYWRQFAIRTGSASYTHEVIAAGWRKKGWCGSDQGLRLQKDCEPVKNALELQTGWKCINDQAELPPEWKSEEQFFEWIAVPWIDPRLREVGMPNHLLAK